MGDHSRESRALLGIINTAKSVQKETNLSRVRTPVRTKELQNDLSTNMKVIFKYLELTMLKDVLHFENDRACSNEARAHRARPAMTSD